MVLACGALAANGKVRLFKKLNALRGQRECSFPTSSVSESGVALRESSLATWANSVMGAADVIGHLRGQWRVYLFRLLVLVFEVFPCCCSGLHTG